MKIHTNEKLFHLAQKNAQRRALERYFGEIQSETRNVLTSVEQYFHPTFPQQIKKAISTSAKVKDGKKQEFYSVSTSSFKKALSDCQLHLENLESGEYYLIIQGTTSIFFGLKHYTVSTLPIFKLDADLLAAHANELISSCNGDLVLVNTSTESYLSMESYSGYLPEEPSPDRNVYDIRWSIN